MNLDKTEATVISTNTRQRADNKTSRPTRIKLAASVRSLGVMTDRALSFNEHVDGICKSLYFHWRALRHIRNYVSEDTANHDPCAFGLL